MSEKIKGKVLNLSNSHPAMCDLARIIKIVSPKDLSRTIVVFFCVILSISCGIRTQEDSHTDYFDAVMKKVDAADAAHMLEALAFLDSAFYAFPNPGDLDKIRRFNAIREYHLRIKKDYAKALLYTDSSLQISERRLHEPAFAEKKVDGLKTLGDIYYHLKNYDECLRYYVSSKLTARELIKDHCGCRACSGIADILFYQGSYLAAASQYLENYQATKKCEKDPWLRFVYMQGNLTNAGLCYDNLGMIDSARYYFDSAVLFITHSAKNFPKNQSYIKLAKAVAYRGQGVVLAKAGKGVAARDLYLLSIQGTKNDYIDFTKETKLILAAQHIENNEPEKAKPLLYELQYTNPLEGEMIPPLYRTKVEYFKKLGKNDSAYKNLQKFVEEKDTLDARKARLRSIDIGKEFENREQKAINQLLVSENRAKSFHLAVAALLAVLALVIILFVGYNLRRTSRYVKGLQKLNKKILQQKDDLQKAYMSLEQSQEENTRITRMVAHDLKNPISGIRVLVSSMLRKERSEDIKESLELIHGACANSVTLIDDLLSEKATRSMISKDMVDMKRLLQYCVELSRTRAEEKKQELTLEADPVSILINRQRMWRVVSNIITNAIKFSPEDTFIHVRLKKKEQSVLLSVEDSGIGIPDDLKDKILTLHPEASRPGTAGEESHGLGLAISSKIIEEHNGKLWFESEEGYGCTFYIELPLSA